MSAPQTPSQTVGPYFGMILGREGENVMVAPGTKGTPIRVEGRVLDGAGEVVEDALIEIWQANSVGRYRHPTDHRDELALDDTFTGYGRTEPSPSDGVWWVTTIKPGLVPTSDGRVQAPHLNVIVQARGMLNPLFTRLYFADEAEANAADPVLAAVPADRAHTMIADRVDQEPPATYRLDIHLQGADETVFLDF